METFEMVFYTVVFLVPGFVMAHIIDSINPRTKVDYGYHAIRCLYLSLLADASGCWIINLFAKVRDVLSDQLYWILLFASLMLFASILAALLGCVKYHQLWRRLLRKFGIYSSHSIPYAWDYAFSRNDYYYVYITLVDGAQIYGLYADKSFSSSEPDDRDIYLEKIFDVKEEKGTVELIERQKTKGMLIRGNQISTIEFLQ